MLTITGFPARLLPRLQQNWLLLAIAYKLYIATAEKATVHAHQHPPWWSFSKAIGNYKLSVIGSIVLGIITS